jgi:hypothetical protein
MSPKKSSTFPDRPAAPSSQNALAHIEEALRHLRFGQVTVTVQDGVVVLIERTEKIRFTT